MKIIITAEQAYGLYKHCLENEIDAIQFESKEIAKDLEQFGRSYKQLVGAYNDNQTKDKGDLN